MVYKSIQAVSAELASVASGRFGKRATPDDERVASQRARPNPQLMLILTAVALYVFYLLYLTVVLQFSMVRSDIVLYWRDSLQLPPYNKWWVPGYPMLIALVRTATFETLPPLAVMLLISGASYLVAVGTVRALAMHLRLEHATKIALLFAVFPFVGLTYSVWPIADVTAAALFLLCLLSFERRRWLSFTVYAACALLVHKTMWFFVPSLILVAVIKHRESRLIIPWAVLPLMSWIVAGAIHYQEPLWFVRFSVERLVVSRGTLPVFDGLIGPFLAGGVNKIAKASIILVILASAVASLYGNYRHRHWGAASVAAALILLAVTMNQYQIWVVGRFSRLLVIPVACALAHTTMWNRMLENRWMYAPMVIGCAATNVAFGYYVARFFFA